MVMSHGMIMIEVYKQDVIGDEAADDEGVRLVVDSSGWVLKVENITIEVNIVFCDFFVGTFRITKCSQVEFSIIEVDNSIMITSPILLNFLELDIALVIVTYLLVEDDLFCLKAVLLN